MSGGQRGRDKIANATGRAISDSQVFIFVTGVWILHAGSVVTKNVSITYRGSTDENSWETHSHTAVPRTLRSDSRRLCQSAATASRRSAATS